MATTSPIDTSSIRDDRHWVISWGRFAEVRPQLAGAGRQLLYQVGVGLAFLGTVRPDGGPRVHPMCPLLTADGMYAFIIPSPKQRDLIRDGRYVLHSFPMPDNEDAFYVSGRATAVTAPELRRALSDQFVAEREALAVPAPAHTDVLFEFRLERCLLTRTSGHGDPAPSHQVWVA